MTRVLSNGRYTVLVTATGAGTSTCDGRALTAWSGDRTTDDDGVLVYLRDVERGGAWRVGLADRHGDLAATVRIAVADDDCELRVVELSNAGAAPRRIAVTTYAEVALLDPAAYAAHPGFAKLFVETEHVADPAALLAKRRPRAADERHPWMVGTLFGDGPLEIETDRARFLGRGRTRSDPRGLDMPLAGTAGPVLDPVFALRRTVVVPPGGRSTLTLLLGMAESRAAALGLVARYRDPAARNAAFAEADVRERGDAERVGLTAEEAAHAQAALAAMLSGDAAVRAPADRQRAAHGTFEALAALGIPGAGPIAVVTLDAAGDLAVLDDLDRLLAYWRTRAVTVAPVVVVGADVAAADVTSRIADAVVLAGADLSPALAALLAARADLWVDGTLPTVAVEPAAAPVRRPAPPPPVTAATVDAAPASAEPLLDWNGHGGFTADGREYVLRLSPDADGALVLPPLPWVNVIANERFGCLVTERGAAHTWSGNSREHRLTPWSNDPIGDPHGEALYLRDRASGACWCPQGGPMAPATTVEVRHGLGYTRWRNRSHALDTEVTTFVPQEPADPVKLVVLTIVNRGATARTLTAYAYFQLVPGVLPQVDGRHVRTTVTPSGDVVRARNPLTGPFADRVAFAAALAPAGATTRATADRAAFLGRGGASAAPDAVVAGRDLDGRGGAGVDPCAALQVDLTVPAGATVTCTFVLGEGGDAAEVDALLARLRAPHAVDDALRTARAFWTSLADAVTVATPDPAIDRMVNGWLPYQTVSCRLWGRTAFYQSGGAYGFRDQLQDAAALVHARPAWTRAQIVLHAAHQFVEGDVLHWWHPPFERGMRTRFSDDLLWLPYVTAFYVDTTGDAAVLDEPAPFVSARALAPDEDEAYLAAPPSGESADVYTHCCRALDRSLAVGAHGLPLMGTGDWNDGMNRVGREGRGESVWLAFFLHRLLDAFAPLCDGRGDAARAARYRAHRDALARAVEDAGWDGAWYRRAYYDDGTPLGSAENEECRIDVLVQAWAVLSGAAPPARARAALDAADRMLIAEGDGLIRLLTPPFDRDPHDPGYIKGYLPGIRENGGQYTHAALWAVQAFAEAGRRDRAAPLLAMLSPVTHARTAERVAVYRVEPYVVAADVYGVAPHVGRGGWTWYTGSAGWMLRVALESILGVRVVGGTHLAVKPCVPDAWPGYTVRVRLPDGAATYEVAVRRAGASTAAVVAATLDGAPVPIVAGAARVPLVRDGGTHHVAVTLDASPI